MKKGKQMKETERLSLRAQMLSWNLGFRSMKSVLDEFSKDETPLHLAGAMIGGSCAALVEMGYDHLTTESLLIAQVNVERLWRAIHKPKERKVRTRT
jgi:hypothetical protein